MVNNMSQTSKLMEEINKIKDPETFIGLATLLGVRLVGEEKDENDKFPPRDFVDIYCDLIEKFDGLSRNKRKEINQLLRKANKEKPYGNNTQNS